MQKETVEVLAREEIADALCKDEISFQLVQDVYARIKKKKETKEKHYNYNFILTMSDLEQLFLKMKQLFEQYQIVASENSVTVYHQNDQLETFSSIERFSIYDSSKNSPVKSIEIEYNYLINLPRTNTEKSYTIKLQIFSPLCIFEQMKDDDIPPELRNRFGRMSGYLRIEYVDYIVANTILNVIDGWFKGLEIVKNETIIKKIQNVSPIIVPLTGYVFLFVCIGNIFYFNDIYFANYGTGNSTLAKWLIFSVVVSIVAERLGNFNGRYTYKALNTIVPLSRITLNNGDNKLLEKYSKNNKISIRNAILSAIGTVSLGIIANYFFDIFFKTTT